MQEELIKFKTAKLAKEKGFNIYNDFFYCETFGLCQLGEETLCVFNHPKTNKIEFIYDCNNEFEEGERFYAPTQSLLQKWLREVHNIFIDVNINLFCAIFHNKDFYTVTDYYNIYEEALEIGLQEALKLIEIVKK